MSMDPDRTNWRLEHEARMREVTRQMYWDMALGAGLTLGAMAFFYTVFQIIG